MAEKFKGGCACGEVRYEIKADPLMQVHCQCRDCQRASGTGHGSFMAFPADTAKFKGKYATWKKKSDRGNTVSRTFCKDCGSPLYAANKAAPQFVFIHVASLDEPSRFTPQAVMFTSSACDWDLVDSELPKFEKMPPGI